MPIIFTVVDRYVYKTDTDTKTGELIAVCYNEWDAKEVRRALEITPPRPEPF